MIIEERKDLLTKVGINLEVFGNSGYVIKQLPLWMQNIDEQVFIEDMMTQLLMIIKSMSSNYKIMQLLRLVVKLH